MSNKSFLSHYQSPNIVIVPTTSLSDGPPSKKRKADQTCPLSDTTPIQKPDVIVNASEKTTTEQKLWKKSFYELNSLQSSKNTSLTKSVNKVSSEDVKGYKATSTSWASKYLSSIGIVEKKPIKMNLSSSRKKLIKGATMSNSGNAINIELIPELSTDTEAMLCIEDSTENKAAILCDTGHIDNNNTINILNISSDRQEYMPQEVPNTHSSELSNIGSIYTNTPMNSTEIPKIIYNHQNGSDEQIHIPFSKPVMLNNLPIDNTRRQTENRSSTSTDNSDWIKDTSNFIEKSLSIFKTNSNDNSYTNIERNTNSINIKKQYNIVTDTKMKNIVRNSLINKVTSEHSEDTSLSSSDFKTRENSYSTSNMSADKNKLKQSLDTLRKSNSKTKLIKPKAQNLNQSEKCRESDTIKTLKYKEVCTKKGTNDSEEKKTTKNKAKTYVSSSDSEDIEIQKKTSLSIKTLKKDFLEKYKRIKKLYNTSKQLHSKSENKKRIAQSRTKNTTKSIKMKTSKCKELSKCDTKKCHKKLTPKKETMSLSNISSDSDSKKTPVKSVVQVTNGFKFKRQLDLHKVFKDFDRCRYKHNHSSLNEYFSKLCTDTTTQTSQFKHITKEQRENLKITIQNEDDEVKLECEDDTTAEKSKYTHINLVINLQCNNHQHSGNSDSDLNKISESKGKECCALIHENVSFLDDFNVDEIVESLYCCANEPKSDCSKLIVEGSTTSDHEGPVENISEIAKFINSFNITDESKDVNGVKPLQEKMTQESKNICQRSHIQANKCCDNSIQESINVLDDVIEVRQCHNNKLISPQTSRPIRIIKLESSHEFQIDNNECRTNMSVDQSYHSGKKKVIDKPGNSLEILIHPIDPSEGINICMSDNGTSDDIITTTTSLETNQLITNPKKSPIHMINIKEKDKYCTVNVNTESGAVESAQIINTSKAKDIDHIPKKEATYIYIKSEPEESSDEDNASDVTVVLDYDVSDIADEINSFINNKNVKNIDDRKDKGNNISEEQNDGISVEATSNEIILSNLSGEVYAPNIEQTNVSVVLKDGICSNNTLKNDTPNTKTFENSVPITPEKSDFSYIKDPKITTSCKVNLLDAVSEQNEMTTKDKFINNNEMGNNKAKIEIKSDTTLIKNNLSNTTDALITPHHVKLSDLHEKEGITVLSTGNCTVNNKNVHLEIKCGNQDNRAKPEVLNKTNKVNDQEPSPSIQMMEKVMLACVYEKCTILKIHTGKYSDIYRCTNVKDNRRYALKMIKKNDSKYNMGALQTKMLLKLQQDIPKQNYNCVYLFNYFPIARKTSILFEYYPANLDRALKANNKSFHISDVQNLARQLVAAVTTLRNKNIIHSDIKPSHVLLDSSYRRLKLCGFDSAYYIHDIIKLLPNMGTASYRAPEVILGYSVGFSVDVWATALVLYEMATNSKLFYGHFNNDILYKQMRTLGDIPVEMVRNSLYGYKHFQGTMFKRHIGPMGQRISFETKFVRNTRLITHVRRVYQLEWSKSQNSYQRGVDYKKVDQLISLLQEMLVLHPGRRLPIEFVYAHPFIFEL